LPIDGFTAGGTLNVSVAKSGYAISDSEKTVTIHVVSVTLDSVTADGSDSQFTKNLTLTFSQAITGLSAEDITITHSVSGQIVSKGIISGTGPVYTLPISGFTAGGTLTVSVKKSGYTISGSQTATIHVIFVTLDSVTADGSPEQGTTTLTLTFSQAIPGLSAGDITLSGVPDVWRGYLSGSGPVYTLQTYSLTSNGTLNVSVEKSGYAISGSQTVTIYSQLGGTVKIDGNAWVGQTLAANTGSLNGSGTITYQWKRGETNIGTNNSSYTVQTADIGYTITVTVRRSNNVGSITSPATATVTLPPLTGTVTINGTGIVGQTLMANTSNLGGSGTITYQWKYGTTSVGTDSTYIPASEGSITVTVTRSGNSGSVTSSPITVIRPPLTGTVTITGTARVASTLTANTANLGGSGTITAYNWKRVSTGGTTTDVGSNSSTYIVVAADAGYTITVSVSRSDNSGFVTSAPTAIVSRPALWGDVSIEGTAKVGQTLVANTSDLGGNVLSGSGAISYEWKRVSTDGTTTDVGTGNAYLVKANDVGYRITVTVTRSGWSGSVSNTTATVIP
jgi:hypothetical protein